MNFNTIDFTELKLKKNDVDPNGQRQCGEIYAVWI